MSHVFHRASAPLTAVDASGCWVTDDSGRRYLDAAGGAIVVNVGHGDPVVVAALERARTLDYVHASTFTTPALESYADRLASHLPLDEPRVYPTSGGAESVETALKLARAHHLARGDKGRDVVISRHQSYHGNTVGALDVSDRQALREPYLPWLGRACHIPEVTEYRCPSPGHPEGCARWHASMLDRAITEIGPDRVSAFIGEAVGGAVLGAAVPPAGYWEAIQDVCRRHGVLLIVDEVMTGFGRTGRWFGVDHFGIQPDILVSGKGAGGGYWPLGLCVASGEVHDTVMSAGGFTHGFTFSHSPIGAAVGEAVLERLEAGNLVERSATSGAALLSGLRQTLSDMSIVGDVRGVGLLIAVELVADKMSKTAFPREMRMAERLTMEARRRGLLVYPSTGCADGTSGDLILLGPPFIVSEEELAMIVERLGRAVGAMAS
jgi:adenosylmethionine-8-amino-7-oxononanoate aminotransferase